MGQGKVANFAHVNNLKPRTTMNKLFSSLLALALPATALAQGWPANYGGVMLQGFYWDSYVDTQWANLEAQADELSQYFDLVWVPQSGNCATTYNVMGYTPVYWFDQNSSFGTEAQLRSLIATYKRKGMGVVADVVINHRGSLGVGGSWVDFPAETYKGKTYQLGLADICIDDDGGATAKKYAVTGAKDTGEDWDGMRDLDHTSQNVQDNVLAYLDFLKNDLGYAGFRYDMTKGYAAKYTGLYNSKSQPEFSVGEYWDGNASLVKAWLNGTKVDGAIQSATFDFPFRYSIRDACNNSSWSKLASGGLATTADCKRYAVTFVENHDTQYRSSSYAGDPVKKNVVAGNAFMLAMPGTPCVFLTHWKQYKAELKQLIAARKLAGITNQSSFTTQRNTSALYAATVDGKLAVALGSGTVDYAGYTLVASGENYKVYLNNNIEAPWIGTPSGTYESAQAVKLTALSTDASARLVYTLDGSTPTASSPSVASGGTVDIASTATLTVGLLTGGTVKAVAQRTYTIKPFEAHTATVYVKDPGWTDMYFYVWANDTKNTQLNGSWPGKRQTATVELGGEKWYSQSFDITSSDYSFNIIFDQGSGKDQTVDIGPISEDRYYELSATKTNGKYTVADVTSTFTAIAPIHAAATALSASPLRVHSASGQLLRTLPKDMSVAEALSGLPHGLYIVGGKKVAK